MVLVKLPVLLGLTLQIIIVSIAQLIVYLANQNINVKNAQKVNFSVKVSV
jgi:hypothetical protein